jgi:nitronate monooxygenase
VSEVADYLADVAPDTLLVAAGGVADGRSLAAALMLGADGVLIGSRLVASSEALTPHGFHAAILAADGDATIKTSVIDLVRNYHWPDEFSGRALRNGFVTRWHGHENALVDSTIHGPETERYWAAVMSGDADNAGVFMGEAAGLIHDGGPAAQIIEAMVAQARGLLDSASRFVRRD